MIKVLNKKGDTQSEYAFMMESTVSVAMNVDGIDSIEMNMLHDIDDGHHCY